MKPPRGQKNPVAHAVVNKKKKTGVLPSLLRKTKNSKGNAKRLTPFVQKQVPPPVAKVVATTSSRNSGSSDKISDITDHDELFRMLKQTGGGPPPVQMVGGAASGGGSGGSGDVSSLSQASHQPVAGRVPTGPMFDKQVDKPQPDAKKVSKKKKKKKKKAKATTPKAALAAALTKPPQDPPTQQQISSKKKMVEIGQGLFAPAPSISLDTIAVQRSQQQQPPASSSGKQQQQYRGQEPPTTVARAPDAPTDGSSSVSYLEMQAEAEEDVPSKKIGFDQVKALLQQVNDPSDETSSVASDLTSRAASKRSSSRHRVASVASSSKNGVFAPQPPDDTSQASSKNLSRRRQQQQQQAKPKSTAAAAQANREKMSSASVDPPPSTSVKNQVVDHVAADDPLQFSVPQDPTALSPLSASGQHRSETRDPISPVMSLSPRNETRSDAATLSPVISFNARPPAPESVRTELPPRALSLKASSVRSQRSGRSGAVASAESGSEKVHEASPASMLPSHPKATIITAPYSPGTAAPTSTPRDPPGTPQQQPSVGGQSHSRTTASSQSRDPDPSRTTADSPFIPSLPSLEHANITTHSSTLQNDEDTTTTTSSSKDKKKSVKKSMSDRIFERSFASSSRFKRLSLMTKQQPGKPDNDEDDNAQIPVPAVNPAAMMAALESSLMNNPVIVKKPSKVSTSSSRPSKRTKKVVQPLSESPSASVHNSSSHSRSQQQQQLKQQRRSSLQKSDSRRPSENGHQENGVHGGPVVPAVSVKNKRNKKKGGPYPEEINMRKEDEQISDLDQSLRNFPMRQVLASKASHTISTLEEQSYSCESGEEPDRYAVQASAAKETERSMRNSSPANIRWDNGAEERPIVLSNEAAGALADSITELSMDQYSTKESEDVTRQGEVDEWPATQRASNKVPPQLLPKVQELQPSQPSLWSQFFFPESVKCSQGVSQIQTTGDREPTKSQPRSSLPFHEKTQTTYEDQLSLISTVEVQSGDLKQRSQSSTQHSRDQDRSYDYDDRKAQSSSRHGALSNIMSSSVYLSGGEPDERPRGSMSSYGMLSHSGMVVPANPTPVNEEIGIEVVDSFSIRQHFVESINSQDTVSTEASGPYVDPMDSPLFTDIDDSHIPERQAPNLSRQKKKHTVKKSRSKDSSKKDGRSRRSRKSSKSRQRKLAEDVVPSVKVSTVDSSSDGVNLQDPDTRVPRDPSLRSISKTSAPSDVEDANDRGLEGRDIDKYTSLSATPVKSHDRYSVSSTRASDTQVPSQTSEMEASMSTSSNGVIQRPNVKSKKPLDILAHLKSDSRDISSVEGKLSSSSSSSSGELVFHIPHNSSDERSMPGFPRQSDGKRVAVFPEKLVDELWGGSTSGHGESLPHKVCSSEVPKGGEAGSFQKSQLRVCTLQSSSSVETASHGHANSRKLSVSHKSADNVIELPNGTEVVRNPSHGTPPPFVFEESQVGQNQHETSSNVIYPVVTGIPVSYSGNNNNRGNDEREKEVGVADNAYSYIGRILSFGKIVNALSPTSQNEVKSKMETTLSPTSKTLLDKSIDHAASESAKVKKFDPADVIDLTQIKTFADLKQENAEWLFDASPSSEASNPLFAPTKTAAIDSLMDFAAFRLSSPAVSDNISPSDKDKYSTEEAQNLLAVSASTLYEHDTPLGDKYKVRSPTEHSHGIFPGLKEDKDWLPKSSGPGESNGNGNPAEKRRVNAQEYRAASSIELNQMNETTRSASSEKCSTIAMTTAESEQPDGTYIVTDQTLKRNTEPDENFPSDRNQSTKDCEFGSVRDVKSSETNPKSMISVQDVASMDLSTTKSATDSFDLPIDLTNRTDTQNSASKSEPLLDTICQKTEDYACGTNSIPVPEKSKSVDSPSSPKHNENTAAHEGEPQTVPTAISKEESKDVLPHTPGHSREALVPRRDLLDVVFEGAESLFCGKSGKKSKVDESHCATKDLDDLELVENNNPTYRTQHGPTVVVVEPTELVGETMDEAVEATLSDPLLHGDGASPTQTVIPTAEPMVSTGSFVKDQQEEKLLPVLEKTTQSKQPELPSSLPTLKQNESKVVVDNMIPSFHQELPSALPTLKQNESEAIAIPLRNISSRMRPNPETLVGKGVTRVSKVEGNNYIEEHRPFTDRFVRAAPTPEVLQIADRLNNDRGSSNCSANTSGSVRDTTPKRRGPRPEDFTSVLPGKNSTANASFQNQANRRQTKLRSNPSAKRIVDLIDDASSIDPVIGPAASAGLSTVSTTWFHKGIDSTSNTKAVFSSIGQERRAVLSPLADTATAPQFENTACESSEQGSLGEPPAISEASSCVVHTESSADESKTESGSSIEMTRQLPQQTNVDASSTGLEVSEYNNYPPVERDMFPLPCDDAGQQNVNGDQHATKRNIEPTSTGFEVSSVHTKGESGESHISSSSFDESNRDLPGNSKAFPNQPAADFEVANTGDNVLAVSDSQPSSDSSKGTSAVEESKRTSSHENEGWASRGEFSPKSFEQDPTSEFTANPSVVSVPVIPGMDVNPVDIGTSISTVAGEIIDLTNLDEKSTDMKSFQTDAIPHTNVSIEETCSNSCPSETGFSERNNLKLSEFVESQNEGNVEVTRQQIVSNGKTMTVINVCEHVLDELEVEESIDRDSRDQANMQERLESNEILPSDDTSSPLEVGNKSSTDPFQTFSSTELDEGKNEGHEGHEESLNTLRAQTDENIELTPKSSLPQEFNSNLGTSVAIDAEKDQPLQNRLSTESLTQASQEKVAGTEDSSSITVSDESVGDTEGKDLVNASPQRVTPRGSLNGRDAAQQDKGHEEAPSLEQKGCSNTGEHENRVVITNENEKTQLDHRQEDHVLPKSPFEEENTPSFDHSSKAIPTDDRASQRDANTLLPTNPNEIQQDTVPEAAIDSPSCSSSEQLSEHPNSSVCASEVTPIASGNTRRPFLKNLIPSMQRQQRAKSDRQSPASSFSRSLIAPLRSTATDPQEAKRLEEHEIKEMQTKSLIASSQHASSQTNLTNSKQEGDASSEAVFNPSNVHADGAFSESNAARSQMTTPQGYDNGAEKQSLLPKRTHDESVKQIVLKALGGRSTEAKKPLPGTLVEDSQQRLMSLDKQNLDLSESLQTEVENNSEQETGNFANDGTSDVDTGVLDSTATHAPLPVVEGFDVSPAQQSALPNDFCHSLDLNHISEGIVIYPSNEIPEGIVVTPDFTVSARPAARNGNIAISEATNVQCAKDYIETQASEADDTTEEPISIIREPNTIDTTEPAKTDGIDPSDSVPFMVRVSSRVPLSGPRSPSSLEVSGTEVVFHEHQPEKQHTMSSSDLQATKLTSTTAESHSNKRATKEPKVNERTDVEVDATAHESQNMPTNENLIVSQALRSVPSHILHAHEECRKLAEAGSGRSHDAKPATGGDENKTQSESTPKEGDVLGSQEGNTANHKAVDTDEVHSSDKAESRLALSKASFIPWGFLFCNKTPNGDSNMQIAESDEVQNDEEPENEPDSPPSDPSGNSFKKHLRPMLAPEGNSPMASVTKTSDEDKSSGADLQSSLTTHATHASPLPPLATSSPGIPRALVQSSTGTLPEPPGRSSLVVPRASDPPGSQGMNNYHLSPQGNQAMGSTTSNVYSPHSQAADTEGGSSLLLALTRSDGDQLSPSSMEIPSWSEHGEVDKDPTSLVPRFMKMPLPDHESRTNSVQPRIDRSHSMGSDSDRQYSRIDRLRSGSPRRLRGVIERLRRNSEQSSTEFNDIEDQEDVNELFSRYDKIVRNMVILDDDSLYHEISAFGNVDRDIVSSSRQRGQYKQRYAELQRAVSLDESTKTFETTPSQNHKKVQNLRIQIDEALKTSAKIRSSQERLGAELTTFKSRLQSQRESLSPAARTQSQSPVARMREQQLQFTKSPRESDTPHSPSSQTALSPNSQTHEWSLRERLQRHRRNMEETFRSAANTAVLSHGSRSNASLSQGATRPGPLIESPEAYHGLTNRNSGTASLSLEDTFRTFDSLRRAQTDRVVMEREDRDQLTDESSMSTGGSQKNQSNRREAILARHQAQVLRPHVVPEEDLFDMAASSEEDDLFNLSLERTNSTTEDEAPLDTLEVKQQQLQSILQGLKRQDEEKRMKDRYPNFSFIG